MRGGHAMTFEDKILRCHDCGKEFTFTAFEQEQFQSMGYTNSPGVVFHRQDRKAGKPASLAASTRNYNNHDEKTGGKCFQQQH